MPNALSVTTAIRKAECSYAGCDRPSAARGLCSSHYMQTWRHGRTRRPRNDTAAVEHALAEAREAYAHVTTVEGRLKWKARVEELQATLKSLKRRRPRRRRRATVAAAG